MITLGSLFDGAGTFPFAAQQCGVKAIWASEIEPFPIEVTKKRFPEMKHLGDITKINGAEIDPVDIITFGSPCQDLSVAGKRTGLDGERSGLFMEAVRIIKEMRCKTNGKYPSIAIWENVPGAFSSNKGEDFRVVLEELCKVKGSDTVIPRPPKRGRIHAWNDAGLIMGDGFSIAWRVLDAEFWGVPQRRRRIFLVADFGGQCAGQVLFEREGLSRRFAESRETWQGFTRSLACCSNAKVRDARGNGDGKTCATLTGDHENRITDYTNIVFTGVDLLCQDEPSVIVFNTLQDPVPNDEIAPCLSTGNPKTGQSCLAVVMLDNKHQPCAGDEIHLDEIIAMATQQGGAEVGEDICPTITAAAGTSGNNQPVVCYALDRSSFNQGINAQFDIGVDESGTAHTLVAKGPGAVAYGVPLGFRAENTRLYKDVATTICNGTNPGHHQGVLLLNDLFIELRRLTPTECGRLQGMPDWWCEDVPHSDSAEYKMWGNGMALPNVLYVIEGVVLLLSLRMLDSILEVLE